MQRTLFQHFLPWALVATCLGATTDVTAAGSFTRGCAARDIQVVMLIEVSESAEAITADQVRDSILAMMKARMTCFEGRVLDALAIYDKISRSVLVQSFGTTPRLLLPPGRDEFF